ncbi:hypothetical protein [Thermus sp.]
MAYAGKGDFPRARADLKRFLKLAPNHPIAAQARALLELMGLMGE